MTTLLTTKSIPGTYWQWRENSIYYVCAGEKQSNRPPLLLVHGFGASTDHWRKNIAQLQQNFQVWAIDLLGFGRSAKPKQEYSGNLWREQLHDFIAQVIGKPAVLAGNSLGGYAALCVASEYSQSVAGLILLNIAVRLPSFASSQAPLTAPQLVCPNTTISFVPANLQANSILPKMSSFTKFPATRALKISPIP